MVFTIILVFVLMIVEFVCAITFFVYHRATLKGDDTQGSIFVIMIIQFVAFVFQGGFVIHFLLYVNPILQALELDR